MKLTSSLAIFWYMGVETSGNPWYTPAKESSPFFSVVRPSSIHKWPYSAFVLDTSIDAVICRTDIAHVNTISCKGKFIEINNIFHFFCYNKCKNIKILRSLWTNDIFWGQTVLVILGSVKSGPDCAANKLAIWRYKIEQI